MNYQRAIFEHEALYTVHLELVSNVTYEGAGLVAIGGFSFAVESAFSGGSVVQF